MRQRFKFDRCFKVDRNYPVTFKWPDRVERTNVMSAMKRIHVVTLNNEDKCDIDRFPLCFSLCSRLLLSHIFIFSIAFMRLVSFYKKVFCKKFYYYYFISSARSCETHVALDSVT